MNREKLLEIDQLTITLAKRSVLTGISLTVSEGELVAIVGPNGAGKTTLLRCAAGLLQAWQGGAVSLGGRLISEMEARERARVVAYVPQQFRAAVPFTVEEFLLLGRYPQLGAWSSPGPSDYDVIATVLKLTRLDYLRLRQVEELSGGERQRVLLAAALVQEPKLLLLDEPTAFLDPGGQVEARQLLAEVRAQYKLGVLIATHDLNGALLNADRVVGLRDGKCIFSGSVSDFAKPGVLRELFGQAFVLLTHPATGETLMWPGGGVGR